MSGIGQDGELYYTDEQYIQAPSTNQQVRAFIRKSDGLAYIKWKNGTIEPFPIAGGGDNNYVLHITTGALVWSVPHNLDKRCSVQVVDNSFNEIEASVKWIDNNEVEIHFNKPTTGWVYCN